MHIRNVAMVFRFTPAGLKQTDNLVMVIRGKFYLCLLEEDGLFRMLTYTNRIRE